MLNAAISIPFSTPAVPAYEIAEGLLFGHESGAVIHSVVGNTFGISLLPIINRRRLTVNKTLGCFGVFLVVVSAILCFDEAASAQNLQTWNGSFSNGISFYSFTMVGTDPSKTNQTTTVPAYVVPIKLTFPGGTVFDPQSIVQSVMASPVLCNNQNVNQQCSTDFVQDGTDLGTTQYIDAFQRGNFWESVQTNTAYHVLVAPTVLQEQNVNVPLGSGWVITNFNGTTVGAVNGGWFTNYLLQTLLPALSHAQKIHPNGLVIPLTYDVCTGSNSLCIDYGFHGSASTNPAQTYAWASYIDQNSKGQAPEDVDVLSHEIGEWMDDPFISNTVPCVVTNPPAHLEVGDPLENHDYCYPTSNCTYHLQDLVWLPYFGQTPTTSLGGWFSFQGESLTVCQNGPRKRQSRRGWVMNRSTE